MSRSAVALATGAVEHPFALLLEVREPRIGIGQRCGAVSHGVGQGANSMIGEEHPLKRCQIVKQLLRRRLQPVPRRTRTINRPGTGGTVSRHLDAVSASR